jgi:hypothetical protein
MTGIDTESKQPIKSEQSNLITFGCYGRMREGAICPCDVFNISVGKDGNEYVFCNHCYMCGAGLPIALTQLTTASNVKVPWIGFKE